MKRNLPTARRNMRPTLATGVFAATLVACLLATETQRLALMSGEGFLHVSLGQQLLSSGALVRADTFSSTRFGQPYVAHEWGFQALLAVAHGLFGIDALPFIAAVFAAAVVSLLLKTTLDAASPIRARTSAVAAAWASATLVALPALSLGYRARPQMASFLFFAILCRTLRSPSWTRLTLGRRCLATFGGFWVWACFHPAVSLGALTLALRVALDDVILARARGERPRWSALAVVPCAVLPLGVTPYGLDLPRTIVRMLSNRELLHRVSEWLPLIVRSGYGASVVTIAVLAAIGLWRSRDLAAAVTAGVFFVAAWSAVRMAPFFAVAALPDAGVGLLVLAKALDVGLTPARQAPSPPRLRHDPTRMRAQAVWIACAIGGVGAACAVAHGRLCDDVYRHGSRQPVAAVEFARSHLNELGPRMYHNHNFGSYLTFALPERKVFIDGRDELYGLEFFDEQLAIINGDPDGPAKLAKWGVDWAIFRTGSPLEDRLTEARWQQVYSDEVAVLFKAPRKQAK